MARRTGTSTGSKRGRFRPFRALAIVFVLLGGAFSLLAHLADPAQTVETNAAPIDQGGFLPEMERKKREAQYIGATALRLYASRMKSSVEEPNFFIGPIEIGMTYERLLQIVPKPESLKAAQAGVIGVVRTDKGVFTAHFASAESESKAFRLSYTQTFRFHTEREITEHMGNLWGKPTTSDCTRLSYGNGEDCQYQWWPINGVKLNAQLRVINDDLSGKPEITLRIDAVDERVQGRRWAAYRVAAAGR
jgi:hypothetical protein